MQQADEIRLFPTSIWTMELNDCNDFNLNFQKYIYDLKSQSEDHIERSNKGGWHSPNLDYNNIFISKFFNKLDPIIKSLMSQLNWDIENFRIGYQELWSIINSKDDFNFPHRHGDSLLSLAYYVKVPKNDDGGSIYFVDPRVAAISRKPPVRMNKDLRKDIISFGKTHNQGKYMIKPKEGMLIIFPSWLEHGVYPNQSDEDTIVISANINLYPAKNPQSITHTPISTYQP